MADSTQAIEWYLARDGRQHGPVSDVELKKIIEFGYLRPNDLVWRQGMAEWALAESMPELGFARSAAPAPTAADANARQPAAEPARQQPAPRRMPEPEKPDPRRYEVGRGPARTNTGQESPQRTAPRPSAGAAPMPTAAAQLYHTAAHPGPQTEHGFSARETMPPGSGYGQTQRRGFPWRIAIVLLLIASFAGGALALHRAGKLSNLPFLAAPSVSETVPVVTRPADPARVDSPPQEPSANAMVIPAGSAQAVDSSLRKSPLWQRLRNDFPEWYQERVTELSRMSSESRSEREIHTAMIRWLIELRRRHNADALAASPARLQSIAAAFVDSLTFLARESTAACYGYIAQGEASPVVSDLRKPEQRAALDVALATIFEAVAEGRKSPTKRDLPRREDYDMLSAELGKRGWSASDLQLFTDARALSRAAPEKVCQMVQDWFAAQLAIGDEAARTRLLGEALKPVVAG